MRALIAILIALAVPGIPAAAAQQGTPPLLIPVTPAPPPPPPVAPAPVPSVVTPLPAPSYGVPPGVTSQVPYSSGGVVRSVYRGADKPRPKHRRWKKRFYQSSTTR